MSKRFVFPGVIALLLTGALGFYIFLRGKEGREQREQIVSSQEIKKEELSVPPQPGEEKAPEAPPAVEQPVPLANILQLDRPIEISTSLDEARRKEAVFKIKELTANLKESSDLFSPWIELGLYRKLIGDFEGAVLAWEYAAKIRPQEPLPHHNLGDLFAYDLKDYQKAETHYLKAISLKPPHAIYYQKLYEFYRYLINDTVKARAILEEGISAGPSESQILQELLASF